MTDTASDDITSSSPRITIETLSTFPEMFDAVMGISMMKRAQDQGIVHFKAHNLRDWTRDRHHTTDDSPYGGGCGLVMKCEPLYAAYQDIAGVDLGYDLETNSFHEPLSTETSSLTTIIVSPQGETFNDAIATELATKNHLLFICGHYEGIDERVYDLADRVISVGDYVLTSGELASLVIIDALVRKIDGVLGADGGAHDESFIDNLLEYPQYTRPASFLGKDVPSVLLSGNHEKIAQWRREQSLERTFKLRPDLLEGALLSEKDKAFIKELQTNR